MRSEASEIPGVGSSIPGVAGSSIPGVAGSSIPGVAGSSIPGVAGSSIPGGAACPFEECDGSGFRVDEETNTASDCRCRAYRVARVRAARLEARIPRKYQHLSLDQLEGDRLSAHRDQTRHIRRYVGNLRENLQTGRGLWLAGDTNVGKTALAMVVSKSAIDSGLSVAIYGMPRLLILLRDVMKEKLDHPGGLSGFLDSLCAVDLLHLDDVGDDNASDWASEQLYVLVNGRYEERRSIVITTNADLDELRDRVGRKTVSRLVEICGEPILMYGGNLGVPEFEPPRQLVEEASQPRSPTDVTRLPLDA
ncbi:MAG: ATP-binding protein [Solirubrobacteraceae bacterium]